MKQGSKKILKVFCLILFIILAALVFLGIWLYNGTLTQAKIQTFKIIPLPMALVEGQPIPMNKFILRYDLAQNILGQDFSGQSGEQVSGNITNQLISEQKTSVLAEREDITVNQKQIDNEYDAISAQNSLAGKTTFAQQLQSDGLTMQDYKNEVIQPQLLLTNLQTWFYSQTDLNSDAYNQANSLIQKIQNGADMAVLASNASQDNSGKQAEGDLGFVDITQLLPELREGVGNMKVGDIKIIPSRYGLHIIKLEAKNGNQLHLRQIFLNGVNFQMWYNNETNGYKVTELIKT